MANLIIIGFGLLLALVVAGIIAWPCKEKGIEIDFDEMKEGEDG